MNSIAASVGFAEILLILGNGKELSLKNGYLTIPRQLLSSEILEFQCFVRPHLFNTVIKKKLKMCRIS